MENQASQAKTTFTSGIWRSLIITIGLTAVLPYIVYRLASLYMPDVPALLLAGIPPAAATALDLLRTRRVNLFGMFALLAIALNLVSALLFKDARLLLVSNSLMPGVYGAIMLISVLRGKPILLTLIRSTLAGAPPAERAQLEKRWLANSSSSFSFVTTLWGVGLLAVPVISITLIYTLTVQQYAPIGPIIQYAMFGTLLLISHISSLIRRVRKNRAQVQQHLA
ncbi:MAG TPA: VC0807 family protein [Ktedonobacteraceae bacterium]